MPELRSDPSEPGLPASLTVSADLLAVRKLAGFLHSECARAGVAEDAVIDLELALVEAANNVVEHGYEGMSGGTMSLRVEAASHTVRLVLTDGGIAVPEGFFSAGPAAHDALSGRGSGIIRACVDEIRYASASGVNSLEMIKRT